MSNRKKKGERKGVNLRRREDEEGRYCFSENTLLEEKREQFKLCFVPGR